MWPTLYTMAATTSPNVREIPTCVTTPPRAASTMMAPHPANTRMNVLISSAIAFFSREMLWVNSAPQEFGSIGSPWVDNLPTLLSREKLEGAAGMSIRMSAIFVLMGVDRWLFAVILSTLRQTSQRQSLPFFFFFVNGKQNDF
jgi:hypothetical protein